MPLTAFGGVTDELNIGDLPKPENVAGLRAWLKRANSQCDGLRHPDRSAEAAIAARAWVMDNLLAHLWSELELPEDLSLLAVGGYGRGELHPHSDIDLLVLSENPVHESPSLTAFFTVLWDLNLDIGHSVRSIEQCIEAAKTDLSLMTSFMECRLLVDVAGLHSGLARALVPECVWPGVAYFRAKYAEQLERQRRFHDTEKNLEPNLKDGPGGLRDIQTLHWMVRRLTDEDIGVLVQRGLLAPAELEVLTQGASRLSAIRYQLHLLAGRKEDRILFQYQPQLADYFGFTDDHDQNLAVEQFMQGFYRATMRVRRINQRVIQLLEHRLLGNELAAVEQLGEHFDVVGGLIRARDAKLFTRHPEQILEIFHLLKDRSDLQGIDVDTERAIRASLHVLDASFRDDPSHRRKFMEILRSGGDIPECLKMMHEYEVLDRYLPIFGAVTGRMQFDLFHVYTVDQHTLTVLGFVRSFFAQPDNDRFPMCGDIAARLAKPELLYLGALFHDIAKGRGGDHSELGAADAAQFCRAHELSDADAQLVVWLVENHLIMSVTAQKKDIADPQVVHEFSQKVGTRVYLDYLYLLTMADIAGTSPKLWNSWKATLLADLYRMTRVALSRGLENPAKRLEMIVDTKRSASRRLASMNVSDEFAIQLWDHFPDDYFLRHSPDQIVWHTEILSRGQPLPVVAVHAHAPRGATEIMVYAENRDGTFASIAWVLGRLALNIIDARLFNTPDDRVIDTFLVLDNNGRPVEDPATMERIIERLSSELTSSPSLGRERTEGPVPERMRPFMKPPKVTFEDGPDGRTQMSLECSDRPGLLARAARILLRHSVRVHGARIATFGERVEDEFSLTDFADQPLSDDIQRRLTKALTTELQIDD